MRDCGERRLNCMKRFVSILTIVAAVCVVVPVGGAYAAEGIEISPTIIEQRIDPGVSYSQVIKLRNPGEAPQTFYPRLRDVSGMDEKGAPIFISEDVEKSGAELSSWSVVSPDVVVVEPGTDASVTLTIAVPANAPIGGAFGAVLFATEPPALSPDASAVAIAYSAASLVAVRIGDDGSDDAAIREFSSDKSVYGSPAASFTTRIENLGTALAKPYGEIQIFDTFGRFTASVSFNEKLGGILPKQLREFTTSWQGEGFALGRYKANLVVTYGDSVKKSLLSETTFWILPGKLSLIVLGGAAALFLLVYIWIRSYIRRALKGSGSETSTAGPVSFFAVFISIIAVAAIIVGIIFFLLA